MPSAERSATLLQLTPHSHYAFNGGKSSFFGKNSWWRPSKSHCEPDGGLDDDHYKPGFQGLWYNIKAYGLSQRIHSRYISIRNQ